MELPLLRKRSAVHRPEPVRRPCPRGVSPARLGSIAAICGALTAGSAKGAIYTWSPTGAGTYAWGLGANWSPAGFPNAIGDTANLNNNLIGNQAISLSQTVTVGSLLLGDPDGTHSFTLQSGANALGAPGTLNLDAVSGFVSILKAAGAEATDVISTGVQFNDDLALTNNSPAGRLLLTGPLRSLESNISFNGAGFINVGAISTGGGLAKSDAGVTVLSGANTYSGATTVNGGTLRLGNNALPVRSAVTVAGGATLDVGFGGTIGSLTGGGTVTTSTGATLTIGRDDTNSTFTGTINGGLNLFKSGQGVLNWAPGAASTYTGTTTLNGGGLVLDFANTTQTSVLAATAMTFGGGDFTIKGKAGLAVNQMLGNLTVDKMGGSFTLVAGDAAGTTVTFGNSITTTTGGALLITAPANTAVRFGVPLPAPSNRLVFSDGTAGNYNWAMNSGGGTATAGFTSYTALPTTGGTTADRTILAGSQTQTGVTSMALLKLASSTGSGQTLDLGAFNMVINSGGLLIAGTDSWNINGSGSLQGATTFNDLVIYQYNNAAPVTINAGIANNPGMLNLVKVGLGTLTLAGNNTFTGQVFVNGGTLSFSNANATGNGTLGAGAGASAQVSLRDGATLQYTGPTGTIAASTTANSHPYALQGGNASIDVTQSGTVLTLGGAISGAGGLTKLGAGTLITGGAATYTGPTIVSAGTLKAGNFSAFGATVPVTLQNSTILDITGFSQTIGSLSSSSSTTTVNSTSAATLTLGGDNTSTSYAGTFTGAAANLLTKVGVGALTLSGSTSAWTGATAVNGGVLRLGASNVLNAATSLTMGDAAGPVRFDLTGNNQTLGGTTALNFYGASSTNASQATVSAGAGVLTLGGNLAYTVSPNANPQAAYISSTGTGSLNLGGALRTFTIDDSLSVLPSEAELTISATINGSGAGIQKLGLGNLLLTGAGTYTGTTAVQGGTLMLDMNAGGSLNSVTGLTIGTAAGLSIFTIKGRSSAATSQSMTGTFTATQTSYSVIKLDPNGTGLTLTLGSAWALGLGSTTLIDYSSPGTGTRQVVTASPTTGTTLTNGIYPNILVKDAGGMIGFGTRAAGSNMAITRFDDTTGTTLADNSNSATTNFTTLNSVYPGGTLAWSNSLTARSVNSLTIDTTNNGGTIDLGAATNVLTLTGNALLFKGGNNLTLQGGQVGVSTTNVTFNQLSTTGILTVSSLIGGGSGGKLTKNGEGVLVVSGDNTYTGATIINGGTLRLGAVGTGTNGPLGTTGGATNVGLGGALDLGGFTLAAAETVLLVGSGVNGTGALTNSGAAAGFSGQVVINSNGASIGGTGDITLTSSLGVSAFQLDKVGSNTLTLMANGVRTGPTSITAGTLKMTAATALGAVATTNPVTLNGGTLNLTHDTAGTFGAYLLILAADSTITNTTASATTGVAQTLGAITLDSHTLTIDSGSVPATGSQTLNLGAATLIGNPTLNIVNSTGGATTVVVLGGLNGGVVAPRTITKSGNGTLTLASGASLVDGTRVNVTGGLLNANHATAMGTFAAVDVASGATLAVGASQQIGSLSGAGSVTLGNAFVLTVGNTASNLSSTFSGTIGGGNAASGLAKVGSGTLTLSGASTFTGSTSVNDGTVVVSGSLAASTVTVGGSATYTSAAILRGTGTVGSLQVGSAAGNPDATVDPGLAAETAGVLNAGTFSEGSHGHFALQLGGSDASTRTAGVDYDQIKTSGSVSLTAGADLQLTLLAGYVHPAAGTNFFVVSNGGVALTGTFTSLNGLAQDLSDGRPVVIDGNPFLISYTGRSATNTFSGAGRDLVLQAIPEPASIFSLLSGLALCLLRRRRADLNRDRQASARRPSRLSGHDRARLSPSA